MKTTLAATALVGVMAAMMATAPPAKAAPGAKAAGGKNKSAPTANQKAQQEAYLGVAVEPLHPSLWQHLQDVLEHRQGVLVADVVKGSAADKAGLKTHDILMSFGDQKLFSPRQLAALVEADKPGQKVTLGIVRDGKPEKLSVTLGEHAATGGRMAMRPRWRIVPRSSSGARSSDGKSNWESFDSLTLRSLGEGRYHVEIGYETADGKIEHRTFEGTREELHQDIMAQKDLPENERNHLLRALDTPQGRILWDFDSSNSDF